MKSLEELKALRDKARSEMGVREGTEAKTRVLVGMATCGIAAGARPVLQAIVDEVASKKLQDIVVGQTGCIGICQFEPVVEIYSPTGEKTTYVHVTPERAVEIVEKHLVEGKVLADYVIGEQTK